MKKYLVAILFLISSSLLAQFLKVYQEDYYYAEAGEECVSKLKVQNLTDKDLEIFITRKQTVGTTRNYMCWKACHSASTRITSSMIVPAYRTVENFSGHIPSMPEDSSIFINYCFNIVNRPDDGVCVDIHYTSDHEYLGKEEVYSSTFSVHPNPAREHLTAAFEGLESAKFIIYNVLGNQVYENTGILRHGWNMS